MSNVIGVLVVAVAMLTGPSRYVGRGRRAWQLSPGLRTLKLLLTSIEGGAVVGGIVAAFGVSPRTAAIGGAEVTATLIVLYLLFVAYVAATRMLRPRRYEFVRALRHASAVHGIGAPGAEAATPRAVISQILWFEWKDRTDGVSAADYIEMRWDEVARSPRSPSPPAQ
ncbi:MAG TPA: hypothetical protein VFO60_09185 [Candidatus Dormibacteraeota bacterium]|nr:hypothetical protein [Candidatus Dormibacteraeota bacterium]